MGRNLGNHSESPIGDRGRSPRRSPSRRERSPVRRKSSHRDASPTRDKEKRSSRTKHAESHSRVSTSPSPRVGRLTRSRDGREGGKLMDKEHETNNGRRSDKGAHSDKSHSPIPRSPSPRSKRLMRARNEREVEKLVERENERNRDRGTRRERSHSPVSHSPSPRAKRLRRAQDGKEHEKNHGRGSDRGSHRERETGSERKEKRGFDRDIEVERKERRLGRDEVSRKSTATRHERSSSPSDKPHRSRHKSRSPHSADGARDRHEGTNFRGSEHGNDDNDSVAKMKAAEEALETKEKEKPSFELSGKLAAETNRFRGVTLLFNEPPEARKPTLRWRLYVFKAGEVLKEPLYIHRQSCYLFGRERRVADIPTDHPSCSKQHAVIQYRQVEKENADGTSSKQIKPYLMDLGSTNKTYLNENPIEPQRYYELFEKDTIKFGNSSREYVLLHENSVQ